MTSSTISIRTDDLIRSFRAASGNQKALTMEEYLLVRKTVIEEQRLGIWDDVPAKETVSQRSESVVYNAKKKSAQNVISANESRETTSHKRSAKASAGTADKASGFSLLQGLTDPWN